MLKNFSPLAINLPVGSHTSSSPISTCMGAAPPSPIPPETRENVVMCQLLTCGQINFLQKGIFQHVLVPEHLQRFWYRYSCRYQYWYGRYWYVRPSFSNSEPSSLFGGRTSWLRRDILGRDWPCRHILSSISGNS